jgi:hypothetical protein
LSLCGCGSTNTPTNKVEKLLSSYQTTSDAIVTELDDYLKTLDVPSNYYDDYKNVYLKQYKDLTYKVKNEKIDGDQATVTTQIEVYDYYKTENDVTSYIASHPDEFSDNGVYSTAKGLKYKIDELNKTTDRVTYTLEITLTKVNDNWTIDNLTNEELEKIHGTFAH